MRAGSVSSSREYDWRHGRFTNLPTSGLVQVRALTTQDPVTELSQFEVMLQGDLVAAALNLSSFS